MAEGTANLGIIGRDFSWEEAKDIEWLMTVLLPMAGVDEGGVTAMRDGPSRRRPGVLARRPS